MESKCNSSLDRRNHLEHNLHVCSNEVQDIPADEAQKSTGSLCQVCLGYDLLQRLSHSSIEAAPPTTSVEPYARGSVENIRSRNTCPFCRLVCRLIPPDLPSGTQIYVHPNSDNPTDRRLNIYTGLQYQRSVEILHGVVGRDEGTVWQTIEPAQICWYLQRCEKDHDHSRLRDHTPVTITLIDVVESRLVTGSSRERYFALSYVWGKVSMFQTTMSNRLYLEEPGSLTKLMEEIPQIIRDSISLILAMGERYLWVDSLCIEQDNESQKHAQISQMDSVHSQAVATIVALSSLNAASSLPGVRRDTMPPLVSYKNMLSG